MNRNGIDPGCKNLGPDDALLGATDRRGDLERCGHVGSAVNWLSRFVVDVYLFSDGPVRVRAEPGGEDAVELDSGPGFVQTVSAGPVGLGPKATSLAGRSRAEPDGPARADRDEELQSLESEDEMSREATAG